VGRRLSQSTYPLKAWAFQKGTQQNGILVPLPFFGGDWSKIVASTNEGKVAFLTRFFSDAAREPRGQLKDGVRKAMSRIVAEFYAELRTTAEI